MSTGRQGGRGRWAGVSGASGGTGSSVPQSFTLTRTASGRIATITPEGETAWTIARNADDSIISLNNTVYLVTLDRDGDGILTGVTATTL